MYSEDVAKRFWSKVEKTDSCWVWRASTLVDTGYGQFAIKHNVNRHAHRVAYELVNGKIPPGMVVCHKCDNRLCVNPDHLFIGTYQDNMRDMVAKGRQNWGIKFWSEEKRKSYSGKNSSNAKYSLATIKRVRQLRKEGHSFREISKDTGVSYTQVRRIVYKENWKYD